MVTVERALPWRRKKKDRDLALEPLISPFQGQDREKHVDIIEKAYVTAAKAHSSQRRKSGEPYITHPLAVAGVVASLGLDHLSIAAALLHDAVEDTQIELSDIERSFGSEVAMIVDGVTKLDRLYFNSKEDQQAATFRKMIVAMAKDLRVLIVKLCDRLHNMRTIAALPYEKRIRIANETMEIYAPLANRLGMQYVKMQLEDLCFATLHPQWFAEIEHMVAMRSPEREFFITQVLEMINNRLDELNINALVVGREKHLFSIHSKMQQKNKEFDEIFDLVGIRLIVDSVRDCYATLGTLHSTWKPVQGRFKDYIAMPKFNLYQSLHTTLIGPQGKPLEVQIRTHEMHERAESGAAAHYLYKEKSDSDENIDLPWLARLIDWEKGTSDPSEFMENLKIDLDQEEVFVFTPKGQVKTLPANSTPIDFAYSIHTDVGHRCVGAKVDGRLVSLSEPLKSGVTVEIFTSKEQGAGPSRDWLSVVSSHRASSKIRQWFSREHRQDAIASGEAQIKQALKREGKSPSDFGGLRQAVSETALQMDYSDAESLFAAIGDGRISAESIVARMLKKSDETKEFSVLDLEDVDPVSVAKKFERGIAGVSVEGLEDVLVRLSRCCNPVPGDEIMGFVTRGRGVSIHRTDCANAESLMSAQTDRLIEVEWNYKAETDGFMASLLIKAYSRSDLLADVSRAFADLRLNIISSSSSTLDDRISRLKFEFEIVDVAHLESVMRSLRTVDGVYDVARIVPGQ